MLAIAHYHQLMNDVLDWNANDINHYLELELGYKNYWRQQVLIHKEIKLNPYITLKGE